MKKILFGLFITGMICLADTTTKANGAVSPIPGIFQDTTHKMAITTRSRTIKAVPQPKIAAPRDTVKAVPQPTPVGTKAVQSVKQPIKVKPVTPVPAASKN